MLSLRIANSFKLVGKIARGFGFITIGALLLPPQLLASSVNLAQAATPTGPYSTSGFNVCSSGTRSFRVSYQYGSNPGGVGANPYRMTARLFKDGHPIGTSEFQASEAWSNHFFYGVGVTPGNYTATLQFEKRTITGWDTLETVSTNSVAVYTVATPDFNVNGIPVPADGAAIEVCASYIKVNAAATTCETNYWVGVQERDQWWNRTYQYEWGNWFSGQAPDGISLQQLAVGAPNWSGAANRKGGILFCGYLDAPANSLARHYVVGVCTGEPSWQCKSALIKLNCSC